MDTLDCLGGESITRKRSAEEAFDEETRNRLEELGYINGGCVYEFPTLRRDLDLILDDIEDETGLRFKEGTDGHASFSRNTLRLTSKEEIPDSKLEEIEKIV